MNITRCNYVDPCNVYLSNARFVNFFTFAVAVGAGAPTLQFVRSGVVHFFTAYREHCSDFTAPSRRIPLSSRPRCPHNNTPAQAISPLKRVFLKNNLFFFVAEDFFHNLA